jgi:transcriptional regulator, propionate catabolism operon regulatory protein
MINIAVMSSPMLSSVIQSLNYTPPSDVSIRIIDATPWETAAIAKDIENSGKVDIFVCGVRNAKLLRGVVKKPIVEINITGFDLLHALTAAKSYSDHVALFVYSGQIDHFKGVFEILAMKVKTIVFDYKEFLQSERRIDKLLDEGIRTVIGPSPVFQTAQRRGMNAVYIYSNDSIKHALDQAVQIALSNRQETEKVREFKTILDFTYGGIIASDQSGIIKAFNPRAERITGITKEKAIGCFINDLFPDSEITELMHLHEKKLNYIIKLGSRKVLTNYIPIIVEEALTGAVITFQDLATVQEAEAKIRSNLLSKGFLGKTNLNDIHGRSSALRCAKEEALRYATSDATVMILGESGTGKELFARGIHSASVRANQPFVAINCAAFPETLLESELFGYDEGAFTGARRGGKQGLIEIAHHGTFFLDEIAEMPISLQTRLLRVLEEREVMHIGGEKIIHVDIRIIAASNQKLWELVRMGRFREDLYYRLNVLVLYVPPLRERPDDIPHLTSLFLSQLLPAMPTKEIQAISKHPCLYQYDWPGNVRELKNFTERFAALSPSFPDSASLLIYLFKTYDKTKRVADGNITRILHQSDGNRAEAARRLGVSRTTLWRKLKRLNGISSSAEFENRTK